MYKIILPIVGVMGVIYLVKWFIGMVEVFHGKTSTTRSDVENSYLEPKFTELDLARFRSDLDSMNLKDMEVRYLELLSCYGSEDIRSLYMEAEIKNLKNKNPIA